MKQDDKIIAVSLADNHINQGISGNLMIRQTCPLSGEKNAD
tara:strand:+ start:10292 stop:10414 length:123 start_codon:yes stop_codon:yes gene_type:complete